MPEAQHVRCYTRSMPSQVPSRELRNDTRALLRRVEGGEHLIITANGRPVAVLAPVTSRRRWISSAEFTQRFATRQADPALRAELDELAPDTLADANLS